MHNEIIIAKITSEHEQFARKVAMYAHIHTHIAVIGDKRDIDIIVEELENFWKGTLSRQTGKMEIANCKVYFFTNDNLIRLRGHRFSWVFIFREQKEVVIPKRNFWQRLKFAFINKL